MLANKINLQMVLYEETMSHCSLARLTAFYMSVLLPDRAVEILRTASLSNHMSLLIARDDESR